MSHVHGLALCVLVNSHCLFFCLFQYKFSATVYWLNFHLIKASVNTFTNGQSANVNNIHFSFFADNYGPNGVVSIGYAPAIFGGRTHFSNNQGASLRVSLYRAGTV